MHFVCCLLSGIGSVLNFYCIPKEKYPFPFLPKALNIDWDNVGNDFQFIYDDLKKTKKVKGSTNGSKES